MQKILQEIFWKFGILAGSRDSTNWLHFWVWFAQSR